MILWITAVAVALCAGFIVGWLFAARADPGLAERAHRSEAALEMAIRQAEGLRVDLSLTQDVNSIGRDILLI